MTRNNTNFPIRPLRNNYGISAIVAPVIYLVICALSSGTPNDKFSTFIMTTGVVELFFWFMFNFFGDWSKKNGH